MSIEIKTIQLPPREEAIHLLADFATAQAALKAAVAPFEAETAQINAAIAKATAAEKARIEELEEKLKAMALKHGPEIFGEKRGIIENGWRLGLTEVEEVEIDGDEQTVCRVVLRELKRVEKEVELNEKVQDEKRLRELSFEHLALTSLLSVKLAINRTYVKDNAELHADWFDQFGIRVIERESASVKPAPKPRTGKARKSAKAAENFEEAA